MSIRNILRVKEVRTKILITLGLLFCYRIGFFIPLPGVNIVEFLKTPETADWLGRTADLMNLLTGAKLQSASVFSLGVMPYISASIIFSLLTKVVPSLERIAKEGPSGQRKINRYTRNATVLICVVQSFFVIFGRLDTDGLLHTGVEDYWLLYCIFAMVVMTAGTLFIMWLGEQITEHGVGNGISIIIMAGIVSSLPRAFSSLSGSDGITNEAWQMLLLFLAVWGMVVVAVVYMTKAQRRIPIQHAKQSRGRKVYGGQRHFLPLKVNHAGVMPIIFASALLIVPSLIGEAIDSNFLTDFRIATGFWYVTSYALLIFFFSFFWTSLMFQPNEMADNLKEHGSFVYGIRPGVQTAEFLERTMVRITLAGAFFLASIAVLPTILSGGFSGLDPILIYFMSGTSILIVVGVALDLVEKINALLIMRNYEGSMKESRQAGAWGRQGRRV